MRHAAAWLLLFLLATSIASAEPQLIPNASFPAGAPSTTNNDDSCDIGAYPAATLLLPYFEVDLDTETGENTLITITNVTQLPRIARVTLWTDWSYPLASFNVFLTGYDVHSISLLDLLRYGSIGGGTASTTPPSERSLSANPLLDVSDCSGQPMKRIAPLIVEDLQRALTVGAASSCTAPVGGNHGAGKAIGYATIDVVKSCEPTLPTDSGYFTEEILFDNVLTGDYQQLNVREGYAQGGTMVHIRAIPEGGAASAVVPTFARTFYSSLQSGATLDRRQPLPSSFAARWITGGTGQFQTSYKVWREGKRSSDDCAVAPNANLAMMDAVRFDEDENAWTHGCVIECWPPAPMGMPAISRPAVSDARFFPPISQADTTGWLYMNVAQDESVATQSWIVVSMAAEGKFSIDVDATALGNGCSPAAPFTYDGEGSPALGPAPNQNEKPAALAATTNNDDSCDIAQLPAATLLLPYFEVDPRTRAGEDTVFTITNVTQLPHIARVTIWTDRSYPILTFNVFLTGYDIQTISLFDVIVAGRIAPPDGTSSDVGIGARSLENDENALLDIANCSDLAVAVPAAILADVRTALTTGLVSSCGTSRVGNIQGDGIMRGYATIDVVDNCGTTNPIDAGYITGELLHDNALTGDYQQINHLENFAQSAAMVHIRSIPEGGAPDGATTNLSRTFYGRYQAMGGTADRRQPLPSVFAARWISGGSDHFDTSFKIWREGLTNANAGCAVSSNTMVPLTELVRFDEHENPTTFVPDCYILCPPIWFGTSATSRSRAADTSVYPPNPGGDIAGWMYMNLDNDWPPGAIDPGIASQNWVTVSMEAAGRFSVDFDATAMGNGCSPVAPVTSEDKSPPAIGPAPNTNP